MAYRRLPARRKMLRTIDTEDAVEWQEQSGSETPTTASRRQKLENDLEWPSERWPIGEVGMARREMGPSITR
jgi:hypothetical protein